MKRMLLAGCALCAVACFAVAQPCRADQPRFFLGIYSVPPDKFETVHDDGFNLLVGPKRWDKADLDAAYKMGMSVIPQGTTPVIHPAVVAWYLFDEPDLNEIPVEKVAAAYKDLQEKHPEQRAFLTVWSPREYAKYFKHCDILGPDPYPIRPNREDLNFVGDGVRYTKSLAPDKPVWVVMQGFEWQPEFPRLPTPAEAKAMSYLAIARGADSLLWFQYENIYGTNGVELRKALKGLNGGVAAISSFLVEPDTQTAYWEGERSVAVTARRSGEKSIVIVVNPDRVERTGELCICGKSPTKITLAPLEVRVMHLNEGE